MANEGPPDVLSIVRFEVALSEPWFFLPGSGGSFPVGGRRPAMLVNSEPLVPPAAPVRGSRLGRLLFGNGGHSVFKNMLVLATGTIAARTIGLLSMPILARLYTPEDFGLLAVFTSIVALMVPVMTLRYVMAIPLPRTDRLAVNVATLSFALLGAFALLQILLLWHFGEPLLSFFSARQLAPYWWLLVLGTIGAALYELLSLWATRKKAFKAVARTQASQALLGNAVKLVLGLTALKSLGLLVGQIFQQSGGVYLLARNMMRDVGANRHWVRRKSMRFLAGRYLDFPIYRLPSQVLMVFSQKAPLLFSAALFGATVTGQLGLAMLALALPLQLFGTTAGKAYYGEIAAIGKRDPARIRSITIAVIWRLFVLSLVPCVLLFFLGPDIFALVMGEQWRVAGGFASILSVYLAAQFVCNPIVHTMSVFGKQSMYLIINLIRTGLIGVVFGGAYWLGMDAEQTITFYSIALAGFYLQVLWQVFRIIKSAQAKAATART